MKQIVILEGDKLKLEKQKSELLLKNKHLNDEIIKIKQNAFDKGK